MSDERRVNINGTWYVCRGNNIVKLEERNCKYRPSDEDIAQANDGSDW